MPWHVQRSEILANVGVFANIEYVYLSLLVKIPTMAKEIAI